MAWDRKNALQQGTPMILSRLTRTLTISETRRNYQNDKNTSSIPQKNLKATTDGHLVTCTCTDIDTNTRLVHKFNTYEICLTKNSSKRKSAAT